MEPESAPVYEELEPEPAYGETDPRSPTASGTESNSQPTEENEPEVIEARRGMRRYRKGGVEVAEGEDDDDEVLVVSVRLRSAGGKRRIVGSDEPAEVRSKIKRLATKVAPSVATAVPARDDDEAMSTPPPLSAPLMKLTPRAVQDIDNKRFWTGGVGSSRNRPVWLLAILVAAVVAYLLGKASNPPTNVARTAAGRIVTAPLPKLTPVWTADGITQLDAVMAADASGDLKKAHQLALDLREKMPDAPGLALYLTTLQTRQGNTNDAEVEASKLVDPFAPPLQAADVNAHLGFIYARSRDFPRAVAAFADAAAADPFNPGYFQLWAESLRRSGQLQEAINHFREAEMRLPIGQPSVEARREDLEFKVRLTQIEAGKDDELKAAIDERLQQPLPSGYWLLTAAAYALQHNDMTAAASRAPARAGCFFARRLRDAHERLFFPRVCGAQGNGWPAHGRYARRSGEAVYAEDGLFHRPVNWVDRDQSARWQDTLPPQAA